MTGAPQADGLAGPDGDRKPSASALSGSIPSALPIVSSCRAFALQCKPYGVARVLNDSADTIEELYEALERVGQWFAGYIAGGGRDASEEFELLHDTLAKARGEQ